MSTRSVFVLGEGLASFAMVSLVLGTRTELADSAVVSIAIILLGASIVLLAPYLWSGAARAFGTNVRVFGERAAWFGSQAFVALLGLALAVAKPAAGLSTWAVLAGGAILIAISAVTETPTD